MATINSREIVDKIIANDGYDPDDPNDPRVIKIVQYNNQFNGALAYGLVYEIDPINGYNRYEQGGACHNPVVLFEAK